jgi:hypothetical protein
MRLTVIILFTQLLAHELEVSLFNFSQVRSKLSSTLPIENQCRLKALFVSTTRFLVHIKSVRSIPIVRAGLLFLVLGEKTYVRSMQKMKA